MDNESGLIEINQEIQFPGYTLYPSSKVVIDKRRKEKERGDSKNVTLPGDGKDQNLLELSNKGSVIQDVPE